jgi:hypothetical protein
MATVHYPFHSHESMSNVFDENRSPAAAAAAAAAATDRQVDERGEGGALLMLPVVAAVIADDDVQQSAAAVALMKDTHVLCIMICQNSTQAVEMFPLFKTTCNGLRSHQNKYTTKWGHAQLQDKRSHALLQL